MKDLTDVNYYIDQEIDLVSIGHYNGNELSSWHGSQVLLPFLGTLLNEMGTDLESSQDKIVIFSSPIFYNYGNSMPYFKNYKLFFITIDDECRQFFTYSFLGIYDGQSVTKIKYLHSPQGCYIDKEKVESHSYEQFFQLISEYESLKDLKRELSNYLNKAALWHKLVANASPKFEICAKKTKI